MARRRAPAKKKEAAPFMIDATLSPANAGEQRDQLLASFEASQKSEAPLKIGLDGEADPTPCAIQLMIAVSRSARKHDVTLELSAEAEKALVGINLD